jgi:UDP:flavonoid glycosyltransferase YjiC (YdhE family)
LAAGLPQVIVPLFADHFTNAKRVVEAGAGLSVEPLAGPLGVRAGLGPDDAPRIAKAVRTVLGEPAYARAAGAIAEEMASLPSVADVLAGLRAEFDGAVGNGPVQSLFASD